MVLLCGKRRYKTEKEAAGQWGWKRYEKRRVAWQQVLKEVENEQVKHYYGKY